MDTSAQLQPIGDLSSDFTTRKRDGFLATVGKRRIAQSRFLAGAASEGTPSPPPQSDNDTA